MPDKPTLVGGRDLGGRPEKYLPDFARQAEELCRLGATNADLARFFQVAASQIGQWSIRHEEFRAAIKTGKEPADDRVEASLYQRACGFSVEKVTQQKKLNEQTGELVVIRETTTTEYFPPDTASCFIWLKNRRPAQWRDRHDLNGNLRVGVTVEQSDQQLFDPEWLASLPFDEVQRLFIEEIALSPGVALLPAPDNNTKPN